MSQHCPSVSIIPAPVAVNMIAGRHTLNAQYRILVTEEFSSVARYLQSVLSKATGWAFAFAERSEIDAIAAEQSYIPQHIHFARNPSVANSEGYVLEVATGHIRIEASAAAGAFYAVQSLIQLLPVAVHQGVPRMDVTWSLPCVLIRDEPRFRWRGAMLDSCRHFQPVSFIKKFLDLLALHKLNTFHWHLTEDQGWRIEIKKYPRLTEVGSRRAETLVGHFSSSTRYDGTPYEGFYTQDDVREVVAYAAERFINVVPEIEMPGHASAALAAYPGFGCSITPVSVATTWGILPNLYSPSEATFSFLQDVLDEVLALFPSPFIHVGGDEAIKDQWHADDGVQARMKELGVADEHELQSYFIGRMARFLEGRGRRLIGWDEILEGGLPAGATVMSWRGTHGGIAAANAGHDVVMAPSQYTYLDHGQSVDSSTEPLSICGPMTLETAYGFEPIPPEISPENTTRILGIQAQIWTEYISTTTHVEYMAFPRLTALSEIAWTAQDRRVSFQEFRSRLAPFLRRLALLGVCFRPLDEI